MLFRSQICSLRQQLYLISAQDHEGENHEILSNHDYYQEAILGY